MTCSSQSSTTLSAERDAKSRTSSLRGEVNDERGDGSESRDHPIDDLERSACREAGSDSAEAPPPLSGSSTIDSDSSRIVNAPRDWLVFWRSNEWLVSWRALLSARPPWPSPHFSFLQRDQVCVGVKTGRPRKGRQRAYDTHKRHKTKERTWIRGYVYTWIPDLPQGRVLSNARQGPQGTMRARGGAQSTLYSPGRHRVESLTGLASRWGICAPPLAANGMNGMME